MSGILTVCIPIFLTGDKLTDMKVRRYYYRPLLPYHITNLDMAHLACSTPFPCLCDNPDRASGSPSSRRPHNHLQDQVMSMFHFSSIEKPRYSNFSFTLAQVTPVYKKGDPLLKKNYRPVSVLPSLSKFLKEKLRINWVCFSGISSSFLVLSVHVGI